MQQETGDTDIIPPTGDEKVATTSQITFEQHYMSNIIVIWEKGEAAIVEVIGMLQFSHRDGQKKFMVRLL